MGKALWYVPIGEEDWLAPRTAVDNFKEKKSLPPAGD
jgi:hypothetical protein